MMRRRVVLAGSLLAAITAAPGVQAQSAAAGAEASAAAASAPGAGATLPDVVVRASGATKEVREQFRDMDRSRDEFLLPKLGASNYGIDRAAIDALPQGKDTPIDKVLLQAPGVSADSAASNPDFHVRNEYANVQYRINGIQLPEGVSGLGPVLETSFVGSLNLLDGALPAQYGLRTAGVVDIATPSEFVPGGNLNLYAGSLGMLSPSVDYGGTQGSTQFFGTARYLESREGLENPMPGVEPIHDRTTQGKLFGYGSTLLDGGRRLTAIAGASVGTFQIPNVAGQTPLGDFGSLAADSARLNEHETDRFVFGLVALQTRSGDTATQISAYVRGTDVHFVPDIDGDLAFNDVASDVTRRSLLTGLQFDGSWRMNPAHTLRGGWVLSAERTHVDDRATVLPLGADGTPLPLPITLNDADARLGWNLGAYLQDEFKLDPRWTLNAGLRLDHLQQFVTANQLSPRLAASFQADALTSVHAGYARYFTPPMQAQATPTNLALFEHTTQQPVIAADSLARPERSHYIDVGADRTLAPGWTAGVDVYYKRSTDLLDDGQFGQAQVLTQFNYARGLSRGAEFKLAYAGDGVRAYANLSANQTMARSVVSNQYLFTDPAEFAYASSHYVYTDDDQFLSASAGVSYRAERELIALDGIFGSGLRSGYANEQHVGGYVQLNVALAREFDSWRTAQPLTLRLSVLNLLDRAYVLRTGNGIGEFAPQYGPRRGLYVTLTQPL